MNYQLVSPGLAALVALGLLAGTARADSAAPDTALVDAVVRKMESDGSLDRAVERSLQRVIARRQEQQAQQQRQRQQQLVERAKRARAVVVGQDHIRGKADAAVSLIEYSDFECPYCKQFHATPKALLARYGGRVNWVLRNFPLSFHEPAARSEAVAAECAAQLGGNEAYWRYADALFESTRSNGKGLGEGITVETLAARTGLNAAAFARCLTGADADERVEADLEDGGKMGVSGTPTTLIRNNRNGVTEVIVGAVGADALAAAIDRALGEQKK
ncbi:MAG TPA: thioredoxin domain-containing protein [Rhodocyclaceae bacterium]|nr:thioredoxin domain-containing protein [Rhodocyclaceae bacterium]